MTNPQQAEKVKMSMNELRGPWVVAEEEGYSLTVETADGIPLFDNADKLPIERMRKIAQAAAAAPELLAALEALRNECTGTPRPRQLHWLLAHADAALLKARGESPSNGETSNV